MKKAKESNTLHLLPAGPKFSTKELVAAVKAAPPQETTPVKAGKKKEGAVWLRGVEWEGEVKEKEVPGADVGNKLYAGKWRMFKGHQWQRTLEARQAKREKAMKVMERRIKWFRGVRSLSWSVWDVWDVDELVLCYRHINADGPVLWTDQRPRRNWASFRSEGNVERNPGLPPRTSPRCSTATTLRIAPILHSMHPHTLCLYSAESWGLNVPFTVTCITLLATCPLHSPSQDNLLTLVWRAPTFPAYGSVGRALR